jgi:hypothetical protein
MRIVAKNREIRTVEDWKAAAPPKSENQWREGRSAMELARAWCGDPSGPLVPPEITRILTSSEAFRGCRVVEAYPEYPIRFDALPGEPRNADLAIVGEDDRGPVAITVEGKADETFGQLVGDVLADAIDRGMSGRSHGVQRVEVLVSSLLSPRHTDLRRIPRVGILRYQLLTAAAGTLAFAEQIRASRAVLLVHEFASSETDDKLHRRNDRDLRNFVRRLSAGTVREVPPDVLAGPFRVPERPLFSAPAELYIGKVTRNLRPLQPLAAS